MDRREAVSALIALSVSPLPSFAQQSNKVWRIAFLGTASASGYVEEIDAIRRGLRDLGYVEGGNIVIEYRWAESDPERLKAMAMELVSLKVDAIITHTVFGARAAGQATKTIPIVMADGSDPAAAGLVESLARPGGNITGSSSFQSEVAAKRLELLTEAVAGAKRVSVIFNALNPFSTVAVRDMGPAAKRMDVELHQFPVKERDEFPAAFAAMGKQRIEAVVIAEDPLLNANAGAIAALAATHRIPACGFAAFADAGGLLGFGANRPLIYGRAASFVDRILKGAKPGDLPIERATRFELVVNLKAARALGIRIPQPILLRADRVIE